MDLLAETLRNTPLIEWWLMMVLPILGGISVAQAWKLQVRKRTGIKPDNYLIVIVATLACTALSTLVQGLLGVRSWPEALGVGIAVGTASPLLWTIVQAVVPDRWARAMRGGRHPWRDSGVWTDEDRQILEQEFQRGNVNDSLYGDGDTTLREKIELARKRQP